jgi:hypothetical protein
VIKFLSSIGLLWAFWVGSFYPGPAALAAESPFLYGIHDHEPAPTEFLNRIKTGTGGTGGWVTATVAVGANINDFSGADFSALANAGHTVICRINYGYFPDGTIPVAAKWDAFATRIKNFVAASSGCTIWLIANETNLAAEWPFDSSNNRFNYISPQDYAACFRKVYDAIKSVRPEDKILPQALAPWGGPYGAGSFNVGGTDYPHDGVPLNWVVYLNQMLTAIAASGPVDGIALHIGSRGYSYADVHSTSKVNAGGQNLYWSFYVYKDWVDYGIPPSLYHLPIYVTECNGLYYWKGGGPPGEPTDKHYEPGWMQEIFAEFNRYNQSAATNGRPIVRCVNFYRWCAYCDGWNIDGADNPYRGQILADLDASVAQLYRWPTNVIPTDPPAAPAGLTATVGNGKVTLTWNGVAFANTYTIKRATVSDGPYAVIASNVTATTYVNTSFTPGTPYFYRVTARNTVGESPESNTASATPTNGLPDVIVTAVSWTPSTILGGTTVVFRATVKNQGSAPTPTTLGVGFAVSSGGNYTWASQGASLAAGASVTLTANGGADGSNRWLASPGPHTVTANADDINRFEEGLEDNNTLSATFNVLNSSYAVNSGGAAAGAFAADAHVSGGYSYAVSDAIDVSGVANPAPAAVYQSERWQNFTYTFGNLMPGATHTVRLHFAEIFYDAAGLRRFHVALNNTRVLTNLDVWAEAGGKFRALVKSFTAGADADGNLTVSLTQGAADWPKCSGIEILFVAPPVNTPPLVPPVPDQKVNAGQLLSFTVTASDTNIPAQSLTFSLAPGAPPGAAVHPTTGVFTWPAPQTTVPLTNSVTVRIADNGSPPLTNTTTFKIVVVPPPRFVETILLPDAVVFGWQVFPGRTYRVLFKGDLADPAWTALGEDIVTDIASLWFTNSIVADSRGFFRLQQIN